MPARRGAWARCARASKARCSPASGWSMATRIAMAPCAGACCGVRTPHLTCKSYDLIQRATSDQVSFTGRDRPTAAGQCRRPNCPGADIRGTLSAGTHCRQGIASMRSGLVPEHGPIRHPKSTLRRSGSNSRSLNANTQGSHCAQAQVIGNSA